MKNQVKGIEGYANATQKFIDATIAIDFWNLHYDFIKFLPEESSLILDIGAGIGRDAWEFSRMGHSVFAVEPTEEYRAAGKRLFDSQDIRWIDDSLPELELLGKQSQFDFILASGVFHHLDLNEQHRSIIRVSELLNTNGIFVLSLRNGPAGVGTYVFPTNSDAIIKSAESCGLKILLRIDNQLSLMKNKKNVFWSKLVFQKTESIKD